MNQELFDYLQKQFDILLIEDELKYLEYLVMKSKVVYTITIGFDPENIDTPNVMRTEFYIRILVI